MCGILGIFDLPAAEDLNALRRLAIERSQLQRHRGPDWGGIYVDRGAILAHERLAIVDPGGGAQPLISAEGELVLAVNGEIYNHAELREQTRRRYTYLSNSDGEVINALYGEEAPEIFLNRLNGIFAFALWDRDRGLALIARDPLGVCPLYWGHDSEARLWVSSEMKTIAGICADVAQFPPGHYYDNRERQVRRYYSKPWRDYESTMGVKVGVEELKTALERAVARQLMSDVPFGVLLSGGLDSSLITACTVAHLRRHRDTDRRGDFIGRVRSFSIGLKGAPDLAAAESAAAALGTQHHSFVFTVEEGIDALPSVIRHTETYDVTTIRSAIPTYLLARRIKSTGVKMVLSGEGADEVFGGYLYFHKAPSAREFHEETVRKLDALYLYDCLRANKAMMAWGVEMRVPFLDTEFLDTAMAMDATVKMAGAGRMEKSVLRRAFAGCLPEAILWRQKEQFSEGVGYAWLGSLREHASMLVSDQELATAPERFPINSPQTKEAFLYRQMFETYFPDAACVRSVPWGKSIACSTPAAIKWDPSFALAPDPSGRAVIGIHNSTRSTSSAA